MENFSQPVRRDDGRIELPPGFRFHPTDEELIVHYLSMKVLDSSFTAIAIGEVDLNKCEPWDFPWMAKMGEDEWYFFSVRDKKYPMGQRANRATEAGYWKATGKDKEIFKDKTLIGMKKTLVFYKGRAPRGEKTNWVIHEYRLEYGGNGASNTNQPQNLQNEWVLCRVFHKNNGAKILNIPPPPPSSSSLYHIPPLMDASPLTTTTIGTVTPPVEFADQSSHDGVILDVIGSETNPLIFPSSSSSNPSASYSYQSTSAPPLMLPLPQLLNPQYPDGLLSQDQTLMRMLMENDNGYSNTVSPTLKANDQIQFPGDTQFLGSYMNMVSSCALYDNNFGNINMPQSATTSFAQYPEYSSASAGNLDFGTFWNF